MATETPTAILARVAAAHTGPRLLVVVALYVVALGALELAIRVVRRRRDPYITLARKDRRRG